MVKIKKIKIIILLIVLILNVFLNSIKADDIDEEYDLKIENSNILETIGKNIEEVNINSKSAIIFDRTTKKVMWEKNENEIRKMASTTKIMTAIVVLENSNLNDVVTISRRAASIGGSRLKINIGDKISVNDLLYGLMLKSGNDTAVALAEYVGGSIENFAEMMNSKAKELGLKNTNFVTPHGLDNVNHYTTAYELALITDYALDNKKFAEIVKTKQTTININGVPRVIENTNELLGNLTGVDGVKTGFTGEALRCLVTSCTRDENQIITVVLGANTKKDRTLDSIKLIEYAFNNFERVNVEEIIKKEFENWKQINEKRIYINKAKNNNIELELSKIKNKLIPLKKGEKKYINVQINCIYNYEAPVYKNTKTGNIIVKYKDEIIETVDIVTKNTIEKNSVFDYIKYFLCKISAQNV